MSKQVHAILYFATVNIKAKVTSWIWTNTWNGHARLAFFSVQARISFYNIFQFWLVVLKNSISINTHDFSRWFLRSNTYTSRLCNCLKIRRLKNSTTYRTTLFYFAARGLPSSIFAYFQTHQIRQGFPCRRGPYRRSHLVIFVVLFRESLSQQNSVHFQELPSHVVA